MPVSYPSLTCIGTKRGTNHGLVYDDAGNIVGRVFPTNRRLRADMGGGRGRAWTANVRLPGASEVGCSLGTRHPDRWSAARAIRAFWRAHNDLRSLRLTYTPEDRQRVTRALAIFKYDNHAVCGLTARYRGGDPRKMWT